MNREIKFRGQRTDNKKWVYGYYFKTPLTDEATGSKPEDGWSFLAGRERHCISQNSCVYEVIPETIGQYTGLKDENGNEIYEGDLLEFTYVDIDGERYSSLYEVVFKDCCFMSKYLSQIRPEYETLSEFLNIGKNDTLKVIGNIYENSELLEVQDE